MGHVEVQERPRGVEGGDAAGAPGVGMDEAEALIQHEHLLPHEVCGIVAEDEAIDEIGLGNEPMRVVLHGVNLVEDALRCEPLVERNGCQKVLEGAQVELLSRHARHDSGLRAGVVANGAYVADGAVEINDVDAAHVAPRYSHGQIVLRIFPLLIDHPKRLVSSSSLMVRQVVGENLREGYPEPVRDSHGALAAGGSIFEVKNIIGILDRLVASKTDS